MRLFSFLSTALLGLTTPNACAANYDTIHLEPFLKKGLKVRATINGKAGVFLFDTGGGVSNVTPEFAAAIGCKPWGQVTGFTMFARRIDTARCNQARISIGSYQAVPDTLGVFDINSLMPKGTEHIDGTIALDVFDGRAFEFSTANKSLTLLSTRDLKKRTAALHTFPIHIVRDAEGMSLTVNLPVKTADGTVWMEMDSGNTSPFTLINKPYAKLFALDDSNTKPQPMKLTMLDGSPYAGPAGVHDLILDGNLGSRFLERYDVIIDLANKRAWLRVVPGVDPAADAEAAAAPGSNPQKPSATPK